MDQKLRYEYLGRNTDGPLGQIYRLLARPRFHFGGANRACQQIITSLEENPTPERLVEAHYVIGALEEAGWSTFTRRLRLAVAEAELLVHSGHFEEALVAGSEHRAEPVGPVVELIDVTKIVLDRILADPQEVFRISPEQFEQLICNRLGAMGLDATRTGNIYQKDGRIDIVFWPKSSAVPFLGAAQIKHHRSPRNKVGVADVRDFAGALSLHPFAVGILVTNTSFTPDALWFAHERKAMLRLRDLEDVQRWLRGVFTDQAEWRELPTEIELCPGVKLSIPRLK